MVYIQIDEHTFSNIQKWELVKIVQDSINEIWIECKRATDLSAQGIHREFFQAVGRDGVLNMHEFANVYSRFSGARNSSVPSNI